MDYSTKLIEEQRQLTLTYIKLIEDAYNLRELDDALSDVSAYEATLILNQINKLKFVVTAPKVLSA